MESGGEFVWLSGVQRKALAGYCRKAGLSKSAFIRLALLRLSKDEAIEDLKGVFLDDELRLLEEEERQLCRMQRLILRDHVYLREYVRQVMHGGWDSGKGKRRPALPETPDSALSIKALEGIFSRRAEIGRLAAELASKHYSGRYEVGLAEVKKGFQTGFLRWPECPYWMTSQYNRQFPDGPPDRKWCDKLNREVEAEKCMVCWEQGMSQEVEKNSDWESWRRSREYSREQLFNDELEWEESARLLRSNKRGSGRTTENKPMEEGGEKYGSNNETL